MAYEYTDIGQFLEIGLGNLENLEPWKPGLFASALV